MMDDRQKNQKFSEEYIEVILTSITNIKDFYIFQENSKNTGMIHYRALDNKLYINMEEDDEFTSACIQFLKQRKVPVFSDIASLKEYEEQLLNKIFDSTA
jgi:hypothetical protein